MTEFSYMVRITDEQIAQVDRVIEKYIANHPFASIDDAVDAIFAVGADVIDAATLEALNEPIGQP